MASVILDFYDEDAPSTLLGSLEDDDLESLEHRAALFDLGALVFRVPKATADANPTLLRKTNLVRVRYPTPMGSTRVWVGILKDYKSVIVAHAEEHGEYIEWTAPGGLFMLSYGALQTASTVYDQPARGSFDDVPARDWVWVNEPYGAIITRVIEEGRHNPFPDAAAADSPFEDITIDFDRVNDSNGNPWANIAEEFRVPIGSNMLEVISRLATAGDVFLVMDPDLTLHAYQQYTDFATDRTGSFGAGNVRWEKGVNILTELSRSSTALQLTHLLQRDSDGNTSTEVATGYTSGKEHWGWAEAESTNDDATLNKIAQRTIDASGADAEQIAFEVVPGADDAAGEYFPFDDYAPGDLVTVHTGTTDYDLEEASMRLVAFRITLDEASKSTTAEQAYRSLHVVPELQYRPLHTYSAIRDQLGEGGGPGCFCLRLCQPTIPGDDVVASRLYHTGFDIDDSGLTDADYSGDWDAAMGVFTRRLATAPTASTAFGGSANAGDWDTIGQAEATIALSIYAIPLSESATLLAAVQNGAAWRQVMKGRARHGIGITEASADQKAKWVGRIWRPGTSSFIGTVWALSAFEGGVRFAPSSPPVSMLWEATGAAVGSAIGTDWLVIDEGVHHINPTPGDPGSDATGNDLYVGDSYDTDLPFAYDSSADENTWVEYSYAGGGGIPGAGRVELIGTSSFAKHCDDTEHFISDREPTPVDDVDQGFRVGTLWLDETTGRVWWLTDNTAGAAVWVLVNIASGGGGGGGGGGTTITIKDESEVVLGSFDTLIFPDGILTDNADGSVTADVAAAVHTHGVPSPGVHKILIQRTTDFSTANNNNSMPDYDTVVEDTMTDSWFDIGSPDRLVVTADYDGLDAIFTAKGALNDPGSSDYLEAKLYLFPAAYGEPRPLTGTSGEEDHLLFVDQQHADDNVNQFDLASSDPVTVHTGDQILVAWRTSTAQTLSPYNGRVGITLGAYIINGGSGGGGGDALDDLSDVTITAPAEDDDLRFDGAIWVNDPRKWEAVTDGEDVFVWEGDDLVHEWNEAP